MSGHKPFPAADDEPPRALELQPPHRGSGVSRSSRTGPQQCLCPSVLPQERENHKEQAQLSGKGPCLLFSAASLEVV